MAENPTWITEPQPARTYPDPVYCSREPSICPYPSNVFPTGNVIGRWFISREEGGDFEFVSEDEWKRLRPLVPIYGERIGDRMVIWDRIVDESPRCVGRGGKRESIATVEDLVRWGYRDVVFDGERQTTSNTLVAIRASEPDALARAAEIVWQTLPLQNLANNTHRIGPFDLADNDWPEKMRASVEDFRRAYKDFVLIESPSLVWIDRDDTGSEISVGIVVGGNIGSVI